jgi:hypothetical protein
MTYTLLYLTLQIPGSVEILLLGHRSCKDLGTRKPFFVLGVDLATFQKRQYCTLRHIHLACSEFRLTLEDQKSDDVLGDNSMFQTLILELLLSV